MISQQDSVHFNQIKSTEMLGWFRENKLYRYDALGGVTAIFYMADEDVITTINVKEAKSLTAAIKDAQAQRLLYLETIKSDVYPVGELAPDKQRLHFSAKLVGHCNWSKFHVIASPWLELFDFTARISFPHN